MRVHNVLHWPPWPQCTVCADEKEVEEARAGEEGECTHLSKFGHRVQCA